MRRFGLILAMFIASVAQTTRVDVSTQAQTIDFSRFAETRPAMTGVVPPATCNPGDLFVDLAANRGANLLVCVAPNQWQAQGLSLSLDGTAIGSGMLNVQTGEGVVPAAVNTGYQNNLEISVDSAVVETIDGEQAGQNLACLPNGGNGAAYACSLPHTLAALSRGTIVHLIPDVADPGGPTTLSVDTLQAPLKERDGLTDPSGADLPAGQMVDVWFDGTVFRIK